MDAGEGALAGWRLWRGPVLRLREFLVKPGLDACEGAVAVLAQGVGDVSRPQTRATGWPSSRISSWTCWAK